MIPIHILQNQTEEFIMLKTLIKPDYVWMEEDLVDVDLLLELVDLV